MNGGAAGAAAAAAVIRAIKASGAIVRVKPDEFRRILDHNREGLVVHAMGGWMWGRHKYLMGYKGLMFQSTSRDSISIPGTCQVVEAKRIWVP